MNVYRFSPTVGDVNGIVVLLEFQQFLKGTYQVRFSINALFYGGIWNTG